METTVMLFDGEISPTIEVDARTLGFDLRKAMALVKSRRWFGQ